VSARLSAEQQEALGVIGELRASLEEVEGYVYNLDGGSVRGAQEELEFHLGRLATALESIEWGES
jgi:hypothetical protein